MVEENKIKTFNEVSINDIDSWYNYIENKYSVLNQDQINNLKPFFLKLKDILKTIDPNKLDISDQIIEDTDLMLWRESPSGISKLVFDEYGQIVYMYNSNDGKMLKGIFDSNVDVEKLLYQFISK